MLVQNITVSSLPTSPHGIISHKTSMDVITVMRTLNLIPLSSEHLCRN